MQGNLHQLALKLGEFEAEVIGFDGDPLVCERLHEMGLHQGINLKVIGRAPWKGPWLVHFKNTCLALRTEEATCPLLKITSQKV